MARHRRAAASVAHARISVPPRHGRTPQQSPIGPATSALPLPADICVGIIEACVEEGALLRLHSLLLTSRAFYHLIRGLTGFWKREIVKLATCVGISVKEPSTTSCSPFLHWITAHRHVCRGCRGVAMVPNYPFETESPSIFICEGCQQDVRWHVYQSRMELESHGQHYTRILSAVEIGGLERSLSRTPRSVYWRQRELEQYLMEESEKRRTHYLEVLSRLPEAARETCESMDREILWPFTHPLPDSLDQLYVVAVRWHSIVLARTLSIDEADLLSVISLYHRAKLLDDEIRCAVKHTTVSLCITGQRAVAHLASPIEDHPQKWHWRHAILAEMATVEDFMEHLGRLQLLQRTSMPALSASQVHWLFINVKPKLPIDMQARIGSMPASQQLGVLYNFYQHEQKTPQVGESAA